MENNEPAVPSKEETQKKDDIEEKENNETATEKDAEQNPEKTQIESTDKDLALPVKDKEMALQLKLEANELFKAEQYESAIEKYNIALEHLPNEEDQDKSTINSNIAICYMRLKQYDDTIIYCGRSLEITPLFLKPKANRAEAYYQKGEFEKAVAGSIIRLR